MVIIFIWTLVGRGSVGWKRLVRVTRRCKVVNRFLLKMVGRGEGIRLELRGLLFWGYMEFSLLL